MKHQRASFQLVAPFYHWVAFQRPCKVKMGLFLLLAEVRRFKEFLQDCQSEQAISHNTRMSVER